MIEKIESINNNNLKIINALMEKASERKKQKSFVVEGIKMYLETQKDRIIKTFISEEFAKNNKELYEKIKDNDRIYIVKTSIFKKISDTITPQGILAIVKMNEYTVNDCVNMESKRSNKKNRTFLLLETIQDPGNLGTIIRTAEAAGVSAIFMNKSTVDAYNPKVVRSTMGSLYRVPFVYEDIKSIIDILKENNIKLLAAHLDGVNYHSDTVYKNDVCFMIGNEGHGLSEEVSKLADEFVKIPMNGEIESLNAAVAAAILMYEASKY